MKALDQFTADQFQDIKDIILGGTNLRARDRLVPTDPNSVSELMEAAELANFLARNDGSHDNMSAIKATVQTLLAPIKQDLKSIKDSPKVSDESHSEKVKIGMKNQT